MAKAAKFLGGALAAVLALLASGYFYLQTAGGRSWLEAEAARLMASPGESVAVAGLEGSFPFDFRVAAITIADRQGPRIRIDDASVAISAKDVLRGHVVVRRIAAREIDVMRASQSPSNTDWAALFDPPLPVAVEHAEIGRLVLGQPVLGTPMTLAATASAVIGGGRAEADLAAHRTDGTPGEVALHVRFDGTNLALAGTVSEPTGTALAAFLGRSNKLPLTLTLTGGGPLSNWRGDFSLAAGADAHAKGTVTISGDEPRHMALAADAEIGALVPPDFRALAASGVRIEGALSLGDRAIAVEHLTLASAAAQLSATGTFTKNGERLAGSASLALGDFAPLSPLAKTALAGSGTLDLTLGGTLAAPTLDASLDAAHVAAGDTRAAALHASLALRPKGDPRTAPTAIIAAGTVTGAATGDGALPHGLGAAIQWQISARFDPKAMALAAESFAVEDAGATLGGALRADRAGAEGTLHLSLPQLGAFDGGALAGALDASADFRAKADGTGTAVLSGAVAGPRTGIARIDGALGGKIGFSGTLSRAADGTIGAREVALDTSAARLAGDGERRADGTLQANATAALARLGVLDPRLSGAMSASARLAGPPDKLAGQVTLEAPTLAAGGIDLAALEAHLTLARVWPLDAHGTARASVRGIAVTLAADGTASPGALRLTRFAAAAAGAHVAGTAALAKGRIDGTLKGTVPDLKAFSALAGTPIAGRGSFDLAVAGNRYAVTLDASGLGAAGSTVERVHLAAAAIADPFGRPTGRADIAIAGARVQDARVDKATIAATSSAPGRFALDAAIGGTAHAPFTLAAGASLALERGNGTLALARLRGKIGGVRFALAHPLDASWQGAAARFANLDLTLGTGSLTGEGGIDARTQSLHLLARNLPVGSLAALADFEADGALGFELSLAGTRRAPEAHVVMDGEQLRIGATGEAGAPALGLVARADWQDGTVRFMGRLAGPHGAAIGWQGNAPLTLRPGRLAFDLPKDGALAFHLEGEGELAALSDLLPLGQDRIAGHFTTEMRVAGTIGAPTASGRFTVANGRYESLYTGATLAGVDFSLVGDRDRLDLENFAANDGAKGSLHMSGAIDLAAPGGPAFDADAQVNHFRALHRDEASATASGTLRLTGGLAAPRLAASLTIDEAEIAVPKELPRSSQPVQAVMIDSATGTRLSPDSAPPRGLVPVALDVTIASPGRVFVRGRGLDSEWRGRIVLAGSTQAPLITGALEVVHGTFDFIGTSFTLSKGAITFLGGKSIDPTIAIEARAQSTEITAIVGIGGTATEPTIKLSSQPALPRDEILSRLLFGASMNQISAAQGLQLAAAAASLSGKDSLDVLGSVRRGLGLDRLTLGNAPGSVVPGLGVPSLTGPPGASGIATAPGTTPVAPGTAGVASGTAGATALNAGKYVANGVYVGVSQGLGASSSTVTVTVDVSRHITLNTEAGQASGSGIGINWKLDY